MLGLWFTSGDGLGEHGLGFRLGAGFWALGLGVKPKSQTLNPKP